MGKLLNAIRRARISIKSLALLCCLAVLLSVLPLFWISFFNHPYYDDFAAGGQLSHRVWEETHSIGALLAAAFEGAKTSYMNWEGNFVPNYLNCIQIGVISQELCFVVTFFLLLSLILSWGYLCKVLFKDVLETPVWVRWLAIPLITFLSVQFIPYANEAFFWQSGGFKYTLGHVFLVLLVSLCVKQYACPTAAKKNRVMRGIAMGLLAALCAGSNLMTGLGSVLGLLSYAIYRFGWKRKANGTLWAATAALAGLAGFAMNVFAPGNAVRQTYASMGAPIVAIAHSLYATIEYIGRWTTLPWFAALGALTPFAYRAAKRSDARFEHPFLLLGGSFMVLASQLAPVIYTELNYDSGRIANTIYLSYCLWMLLNWFYWVGYAARRESGNQMSLRGLDEKQSLSLGLVITLTIMMTVGCAGYGMTKMAGVSAAKSILSGQAARYDQAFHQRSASLEKPDGQPVVIKPMEDVPLVFMKEDGSWKSVMYVFSQFYQKEIIDGR